MDIDYAKVGLKVGLEIHQQLRSSAKLFCDCKPELFKDKPEITFLRRLRPTQSELGQVDPAAFFEFQKGVRICYEANNTTSCLVEMDEEPPHRLNSEAVEIVLMTSLMMKAKSIEEVHVMRKTVIDGSNTTGFQRTCVISLDGEITVGGKAIPIQHVGLEEDAARKMGEEAGNIIHYRIDRLGIPLIEVATGPVIKSPKEAEEVALAIGRILRATGKMMRGLGTIRQDINISLPNGAIMEIKGLQELELVPLVVEYEVQRQLCLIEITEQLNDAGVKQEQLTEDIVDVTVALEQTKSKIIRKALDNKQKVLAVKLAGFKGFLKRELMPNFRLGSEMADRARFWGRVGGIFHTDEMPAYGITEEEVCKIQNIMQASESDAVVFVADTAEKARDALRAVVERAREALKGVPPETRAPNADGTTRYMRPRPGAARMYPETDIPPLQITTAMLREISLKLPKPPEQQLQSLKETYGLNQKLASQIMDSEFGGLFEAIVRESSVPPTTVAVFITETAKALKRDGVQIENVTENQIREIFKAVGSKSMTKEAVPEVFRWLSNHTGKTVEEAMGGIGIRMLSGDDLDRLVDSVIEKHVVLIREKGNNAAGSIIGVVMKEVRGKADASLVSDLVKKKVQTKVKTPKD